MAEALVRVNSFSIGVVVAAVPVEVVLGTINIPHVASVWAKVDPLGPTRRTCIRVVLSLSFGHDDMVKVYDVL